MNISKELEENMIYIGDSVYIVDAEKQSEFEPANDCVGLVLEVVKIKKCEGICSPYDMKYCSMIGLSNIWVEAKERYPDGTLGSFSFSSCYYGFKKLRRINNHGYIGNGVSNVSKQGD